MSPDRCGFVTQALKKLDKIILLLPAKNTFISSIHFFCRPNTADVGCNGPPQGDGDEGTGGKGGADATKF